MPEIEQMPENSYGGQQNNVEVAEAHHKKIEIVVLVFTVLIVVAVIAFFADRNTSDTQPVAVGECIYTNNGDTLKEAVAQSSLNLCNCIDDGDIKEMCIIQVNDSLAYNDAMRNLDQTGCENIENDTSKASCVLAVQDKLAYLEGERGEEPAQASVSTDYAAKYEENPTDVNNLVNLALSSGAADRITQAMAYLEEAKALEPTNAKIYVAEGYLLASQGENDNAIASYTKAIELDSKSIEAFMNRAKTYTNMDMMSEAIADYEKATQLDTTKMYSNMMLNIELCRLYADTGDTGKATEKCNLVISAGSNEASKAEARTIIESLQ